MKISGFDGNFLQDKTWRFLFFYCRYCRLFRRLTAALDKRTLPVIGWAMAGLPRKTALFPALMTAWLVLAVVFAGAFVIAEHGHEHTGAEGQSVPAGDDCRICLEIQIALRLVEAFGRLGVCFFIAGFAASTRPAVKPQPLLFAPRPFALKVKFNC